MGARIYFDRCSLVFKQHTQHITALKWSTKNELLSASADNNSFVITFNQTTKKWKGSLVNISGSGLRALSTCDWSNNGERFAIGSGTGDVHIGYFDKDNNQWDTIPIKTSSNTVLCVKFHPTKLLLACTDVSEQFVLINTDIQNIHKYKTTKENSDVLDMSANEYVSLKGWGNFVAWSPSGKTLTVAVHNSTFIRIELNDKGEITKKSMTVSHNLPVLHLFYTDENTIIASGYDRISMLYKCEEGKWVLKGLFEKKAGGFLIEVTYSAVEKLAREKELEVLSRNRTNKKKFNHLHFTQIVTVCPFKSADTFFTADLKGNFLLWKASDYKKL